MAHHFAHSLDGRPPTEWEPLKTHLQNVAEGGEGLLGAARFASTFGAEEWGRVLGWWHDLGKYSREFQAYIRGANGLEASLESLLGRVDHSTAGARHAAKVCPGPIGRLLAHCIAGHHGGLQDYVCTSGGPDLQSRLSPHRRIPNWDAAPPEILEITVPATLPLQKSSTEIEYGFSCAMFGRMLFSCLVDADYLATEHFKNPVDEASRPKNLASLASLNAALIEHIKQLVAGAPRGSDVVVEKRCEVLAACLEKASLPPGFFSLTVPTGGGKTLSSLAFALRHAVQHDLRRVIYAIPFTSIIEQNAEVFRRALAAAGNEVVLEHHSNFDVEKETRTGKLAAENWDAPLVVTTNVQFFESLFANKPSRCRKVHHIARSVIILDECQTLPVHLLRPTLAAVQELVRNYGCTIVLCTATMPALARRDEFPIGLEGVREIIDDAPLLFATLKRVNYERCGTLTDAALADELAALPQVLCIVNTQKHARELYRAVADRAGGSVFHLSAAMCPAHRAEVLALVRKALDAKPPLSCRVISTQVVEAGVDVDFPVVYRALAGLDSIAQAAGRCNREGRLAAGRVVVFESAADTPAYVRGAADATREVAMLHPDFDSLKAIEHFFRLQYWKHSNERDHCKIMPLASITRGELNIGYASIAKAYRLIKDDQVPILVRYDAAADALIEEVRRSATPPDRRMRRQLQRYAVNVRRRDAERMIAELAVVEAHPGVLVLTNMRSYAGETGLVASNFEADPAVLVV